MTHAQIIEQIGTFKKGVPFTLPDLKAKFNDRAIILFLVGVMYNLIEPSGKYKALEGRTHTPYFIFI